MIHLTDALLLQWPALLLSIVGAWCVAGRTPRLRQVGFWLFLLSNFCWAGWGIAAAAPAIVIAQAMFTYTSIRGIISNRPHFQPWPSEFSRRFKQMLDEYRDGSGKA